MQHEPADMIMSLLPIFILMLPFAIGAFYLSPKIGANRWLWLILGLIPIVNIFTLYVFMFLVAGRMLDRLNAISERIK